MDKLLSLLSDYSAKGKLIDKDFLYLICEYYKNTLMLQDYILDVHILDTKENIDEFTTGAYEFNKKIIELYMLNIQKVCEIFIKMEPKYDCILFKNMFMLSCLIHEMDHAYQNKICNLENDDLKTILLKESYFIDLVKRIKEPVAKNINAIEGFFILQEKKALVDIYYKKRNLKLTLYKIDPCERMARISKSLEAINIFNYINSSLFDKNEISSYFSIDLTKNLLKGYDSRNGEYSCPAHEFLVKFDSSELWKSFDFYDEDLIPLRRNVMKKYSLEERLFLGLPIEAQEEEEVKKIAKSKFVTPQRTLFKEPTIKEHFLL